jgi:acyl carrier protein
MTKAVAIAVVVVGLVAIGLVLWLQEHSVRRIVERRLRDREPRTPEGFGRHYFSPDTSSVATRLREILSRHIEIDLSRLSPDDRFIEDLEMVELDSLSTVNFAVDIEREFGITIPDADAERLKTFRDVVEYVSGAVRHPAA